MGVFRGIRLLSGLLGIRVSSLRARGVGCKISPDALWRIGVLGLTSKFVWAGLPRAKPESHVAQRFAPL